MLASEKGEEGAGHCWAVVVVVFFNVNFYSLTFNAM